MNRYSVSDCEHEVGQAAWNEMEDPFSFSH